MKSVCFRKEDCRRAIMASGRWLLTAMLSLLWANALGDSSGGMLPPLIAKFNDPDIINHVRQLLPGDSLRLECSGRGDPEPTYEWFWNGVPLQQQDGLAVSEDGKILDFIPRSEIDQGFYHCEATNEWGLAKSEVIFVGKSEIPSNILQFPPPKFAQTPEVELVEVGTSATLKCFPEEENETVTISWTKDGKVLEEYRGRRILEVPEVKMEDIGTYACNISNDAGYDYKMVYLSVLKLAPYFIERPPREGLTVSLGQEVIIRCTAKGYPEPQVRWSFEGNEGNYLVTDSGDLRIPRAKKSHQGRLACTASNEEGKNVAKSFLKVVSTTTIEAGPKDVRGQIGSIVKMNCSVVWNREKDDRLSVLWKKDNVDINPEGDSRVFVRKEETSNYPLFIKDLTFEDEGTYTCVASTPSTGTATDSGMLTVLGIPPKLIEAPVAMTVAENSDIRVPCTVEGFPKPSHTWYKEVDRIRFDKNNISEVEPRIRLNEHGTLFIRDARLNDSAKYVCRVDNHFGNPVIASAFIDVRKRTKILKHPEHVLFEEGANVTFNCAVQVDPALNETTTMEWRKDDVKIIFKDENDAFHLHSNFSLNILNSSPDHIGHYSCFIQTPVDEILLEASLFVYHSNLWWIILVTIGIICLLIGIVSFICIWCAGKQSQRKGCYGVEDYESGKKTIDGSHNLTDIQYSLDGCDDTQTLNKMKDDVDIGLLQANPSQPIHNKMKITSSNDASSSDNQLISTSEHSLLNMADEDEWLRRGMEEDGSFREGRYAE